MVPTVTVSEVGADACLLDVREPEEWAAGHAPGAQHIPMYELPARLAEVPVDRDVVVVCRSGIRSARVVEFLLGIGVPGPSATPAWQRVFNLDGGMEEWDAAGRPLVSDTGVPARVL